VAAIDRRTPYEELPEFLSPEEYQQYVNVSRSTVYHLLRCHRLPHVSVGRQKRIPKSVLKAEGEVK
jgi:excisionase family DNA binding protein